MGVKNLFSCHKPLINFADQLPVTHFFHTRDRELQLAQRAGGRHRQRPADRREERQRDEDADEAYDEYEEEDEDDPDPMISQDIDRVLRIRRIHLQPLADRHNLARQAFVVNAGATMGDLLDRQPRLLLG